MSAPAHATEAPKDARVDLRMSQEARDLIDEAAALSGTSRTEYVLSRLLPVARHDVLEARTIRLSHKAWAEFDRALDVEDNERLAALREHRPAWGQPRR